MCWVTKDQMKAAEGFDPDGSRFKDAQKLIAAAFDHRTASATRRKAIEKENYIRWAELCRLTSFHHISFCPPDPMHNTALGITQSLVLWILRSSLMKEPDRSLWRYNAFRDALSSFTWPSHVGRLPPNIVDMVLNARDSQSTLGGVKADAWIRIRIALPVVLFRAFATSLDSLEMSLDNNRRRVYLAVCRFTAALRHLTARSISPNDADHYQQVLVDATGEFRSCGMPLTINWHAAQHLSHFLKLYGPVGSWSCWAYERDNGTLARTRLFRGNIPNMPVTLMNRWNKELLLRSVLSHPAPDATDREVEAIESFQRQLTSKKMEGTLLMEEYRSRAANLSLKLPRASSRSVNLRNVGDMGDIYAIVYDYMRFVQPDEDIIEEADFQRRGRRLPSRGHHLYPFAQFNGYRFCGALDGARDRFSVVQNADGSRDVCRVEAIIQLQLGPDFDGMSELDKTIAIVRYLEPSATYFPWEELSIELGQIASFAAEENAMVEVVPVAALKSSVAATLVSHPEDGDIVITIDFDKEPEEYLEVLDAGVEA